MTERLLKRLGDRAEIGRLSAPLKKKYAEENKLDYKKLLSDGPYKEQFRKDMIRWGEERRSKDPGFFAAQVLADADSKCEILIISDARRPTDLDFFDSQARENSTYSVIKVRVEATEATRKSRNWVFTQGVDDAPSECALDNRTWNQVVQNNGNVDDLRESLRELVEKIERGLAMARGELDGE